MPVNIEIPQHKWSSGLTFSHPLIEGTAEDVGLFVKWLTRAKGYDIFEHALRLTNRFRIDPDNVRKLLHLSGKYNIEALRVEIDVGVKFLK
jgi:hypothetical protein